VSTDSAGMGRDVHILLVEDEPNMARSLARILTRRGYTVAVANNGQEALTQLAADRFQAVITDLNMPVMDGLSFIKAVRARDEYKFVPILMLTTESQADMKAQGKAAGATGWLVKPFNPEMLLQVIAKVVPR